MADVTIGTKLTLDANEAKNSVKQIKADIKAAQGEVLILAERFGATSKEAFAAAKKVAELRDRIKDANETAELFDPGKKFATIGNSVRGLVGGFSALQGAMALAGVEGEDLQRTLLKVQGALALSEGLNVIADVGKDFKRLGSTIVQTLGKSGMIGLAIAGVAALGVAIYQLTRNTESQTLAQRQLDDAVKESIVSTVKERTELKLLYNAANDATKSTNERLKSIAVLQKEFPGYFDDIKTEADLNDKLTTAYNNATAGILNKAKATAIFSKIVENENKILALETKIAKEFTEEARRYGEVNFGLGHMFDKNLAKAKKDLADLQSTNATLAKSIPSTPVPGGGGGGGGKGGSGGGTLTPKDQSEIDSFSYMAQWMIDHENELLEEQLRLKDVHAKAEGEIDNNRFENSKNLSDLSAKVEENNSKAKIRFAEEEAAARIAAAQSVGYALGALSELVGRQTAAGKALGVAQAVINTWIGATEVLRAKTILPEPFGTIAKIANVAAIVASGMSAVKNIMKVQVPGGGGGGGSAATALAPLTPEASITNTLLNQNQLNQIGNAASRAFVVESDVTNNQERIRRLNRAARL